MSNNIIDKIQLSGVTYDIGGSGGGVTSGEVQTMIDQSISGKMDTSAYTVDSSVNSTSTNPVQNQALYNELRTTKSATAKTSIAFNTGVIPTGVTQLELTRDADEEWSIFYFNDRDNQNVGQINVYMNQVTNMFNGSSTSLSGNTIIITYPSTIDVASVGHQVGTATWTLEAITNIDEIISLKDEIISLKEAVSGKADASYVYPQLDEKVNKKFDNSLGFDINDDLGVYAEGNYEDIVFNTASNKVKEYTFPSVYTNGSNNLYKVQNVIINLNQSFSGTVSPTKAIGVKYYAKNDDGLKECWWDYSNGAFTINSDYSANNSVRLTYNSSNHKITLGRQNTSLKTIVTIMVGGDYYIASSSNPTEADCYISYIKIHTSVKKLQSVLNEKQRQLTPGDGIELDYSGNISANIKVTGDTREKVFNKATSATSINSLEETSISFNVNTGYTGDTTSTWSNLSIANISATNEYIQAYIKYDAQNDSFSIIIGGDYITMSYSAHVLTITAHKITAINSSNGFAALNDFDNVGCLFGKVYTNSNVYAVQDAIDNKVDTSDVTTALTSSSTNAQVPSAKCVYDQVGGLKLVKLTQSEYDALDPNYDSNTLYVING